jgi:ribonuclease D
MTNESKELPWPVQIDKASINDLPLLQFKGKIRIITNKKSLEKAIETLNSAKVLGFDTETRPAFKKGESYDISLIQFSTEDEAFLIRINRSEMPQAICDILSNPNIIKTGIALHDDIKGLQKIKPFEANSFVDLSDIGKKMKIKQLGLRNLAGMLLGGRVSKSAKLSNWNAPQLTQSQVIYAATDAYVSLLLYLEMEKLSSESFQ